MTKATTNELAPSETVSDGAHASTLTSSETRQILTPFAFKIDNSLFGLPLARPWKRGVALLIDLMLIAMLAETPGEVLAIVVAITFYRLGSRKKQNGGAFKRFVKVLLRIIAAFILFVVVLSGFSHVAGYFDNVSENNKAKPKVVDSSLSIDDMETKDALVVAGLVTKAVIAAKNSECNEQACWYELISGDLKDISQTNLSKKEMINIADSIVEELDISASEKTELASQLRKDIEAIPAKDLAKEESNELKNSEEVQVPEAPKGKKAENKQKSTVYKGLEWFKGIVDDLGLSFGWAAFYFSVFTSMWKGQTPGKKLLKIKVVQLNGTPLSFWDSFGRYGGYGAGLATGLLGFLQIYWDPNRQAIHDKVSATIVVDLTVSKKE